MQQPSKRTHKKIRAVIFDLDDTLIDWSGQELHGSEIGYRHLHNIYDHLADQAHALPDKHTFFDAFGQVLVSMWREAKQTWAGVSLRNVIQQTIIEIGLNVEEVNSEQLLHVYGWEPVPGVRPFPDTHPVLQSLRQQAYQIGLVTNSMQPMWMRDIELEAYDLIDYLDARITSGDTGYMKPHPAIYERILNLLETEADQAVFVGDRPGNDIAGANEVGLVSVLISPAHLNYDLNGVQPDYTISRLKELLPILASLEGE